MQWNKFPGTDEKVPVVSLGTWVFGGDNWGGAQLAGCQEAVESALRLGMTFIDTAPFYSDGLSEKIVGETLKGRRDQAFVATKCGIVRVGGRIGIDLSPASVVREVDGSLKRLQSDTIDLYQIHWPDKSVPVETTMESFMKLKGQGKIRHIGLCNVGVDTIKRAQSVAPIATVQVPYSLLDRGIESALLPFCREQGIGVISYGAMGGGLLTGKYKELPRFAKSDARFMFYKYFVNPRFSVIVQALDGCRALGHPLNQMALNWVRQQAGVLTVLAGARSAQQVCQNAAAAEWDLSVSELETLGHVAF